MQRPSLRQRLRYADLFDAGGNEIYLEPIEHYVRTDGEINFATLVAAARGIVVNPAKFTPSAGDRAIVLTER
jgi:hypothetical protein